MDYSDPKNFSTMQEEAIRRVKEMQRRSRSFVEGSPIGESAVTPTSGEVTPKGEHQSRRQSADPISGLLGGLLGSNQGKQTSGGELFNIGGIKIDEEKALIGILIYILYKQGADVKLLLALGYLLL